MPESTDSPRAATRPYAEGPFVKTKIVATLGPASRSPEMLEQLMRAGADVFRINFAHGEHTWHAETIANVREVAARLKRVVGILGDLSGPKIRLGELPEEGLRCRFGAHFEFVRVADPNRHDQLTCTYEQLIDDLQPGDRILLADGIVSMRVLAVDPKAGFARCEVVQPGVLRSRQGVNLPGVALSTPAITEKDVADLRFALEQRFDFISLSFVRSAEDVRDLRRRIEASRPPQTPWIVSKIEKTEAIDELDEILKETDVVMVARGDLGVEADIARVPSLQKRIIRLCNEYRLPVITATQMLDSMQRSELPTRAEVSDVANAILDGTDAVMLSGETAIGDYPVEAVTMMSRIAQDVERLVAPRPLADIRSSTRSRATAITEAVVHGAGMAAEHLKADLIAVATRGGKTAMALSKQRYPMPILALTDRQAIAQRMTLMWGVWPVKTPAVELSPHDLLAYVEDYGRELQLLDAGSKLIVVGSSDWSTEWHDMCLAHVVSEPTESHPQG